MILGYPLELLYFQLGIVLLVLIILFVSRELVCWYFKINAALAVLRDIAAKLPAQPPTGTLPPLTRPLQRPSGFPPVRPESSPDAPGSDAVR